MKAQYPLRGLPAGLILVYLVMMLYTNFVPANRPARVDLSRVAADMGAGRVASITVSGDEVTVSKSDGSRAVARKEPQASVTQSLVDLGATREQLSKVSVRVEGPSAITYWLDLLLGLLPAALIIGWFVWMGRQTQKNGGQILSFGHSRAKLTMGKRTGVTFRDVAGRDSAKEELAEVVQFLREPKRFEALCARIPRGILLVGPPGTGNYAKPQIMRSNLIVMKQNVR